MAFKDRLKEARTTKHLTQEQLGNSIGLAKSTITGYEKGTSEPDMLKMIALMQTLDVDANYLLQDEYNEVVQEVSPTPVIDENKNHLLSNYDRLNAEGREKLVDYSDDLINTGKYKKPSKPKMDMEASEELA